MKTQRQNQAETGDTALPILNILRFAALAAALATAGCAEIKQTLQEASRGMDSVFGVEKQPNPDALRDAGQLHGEATAARERGADDEAFARLREAAELGHGPAAYDLGLAYKDGRGTALDLEAGAQWINTAAERGDPRAQYMIGGAYYTGSGVKQDYEVAAGYLGDAAVQGHRDAQHLLAQAFANGRGVPKNATWAARWYGKAAAQGLVEAQYAYGVVHASGLGLPKNRVRGYSWILLAAQQGHEKAEELRRALQKKTRPDQIERAKAFAKRFKIATEPPFADPPTVMYVQLSLNRLRFNAGPVDGVAGKRTLGAIRNYQSKQGVSQDGEISPEILRNLLEKQTETNSG